MGAIPLLIFIMCIIFISLKIQIVASNRTFVNIPVMKSASNLNPSASNSAPSLEKKTYSLRPGEDTVIANGIQQTTPKTIFPMPHLYSGDLYAHEDGETFVMQDDVQTEPIENYNFEAEANKTSRFIPYTYVIELSETYEDDLASQGSTHSNAKALQVLPNIQSSTDGQMQVNQPRLKSEEVEKKVEIYIEQGYDRGAYDHKGYEDYNSKWDKYKETVKGKYGGSSSSKTRENSNLYEDAAPQENGLDRSGSSISYPRYIKKPSYHSKISPMYGTKPGISASTDRKVSIPSLPITRRFKDKKLCSLPHEKNKSRIETSHNTKNSNEGFMPAGTKSIFPSYLSHSSPKSKSFSSPTGFQSNFEQSLDKLFALPTSSSFYNNFKSKHTVPAFPFQDDFQLPANIMTVSSQSGFRRYPRLSRTSNIRNKRRRKLQNMSSFGPSSHKTPSFDHLGKIVEDKNIEKLAVKIGQPLSLLKKEPCLSNTALTANFKFGEFQPKRGPPEWFDTDQDVLEPLMGQVDILRETVYAPALREALCL